MGEESLGIENVLSSLLGNLEDIGKSPEKEVITLTKRPVNYMDMQTSIDQNIYGLLTKAEITPGELSLLSILLPARSRM